MNKIQTSKTVLKCSACGRAIPVRQPHYKNIETGEVTHPNCDLYRSQPLFEPRNSHARIDRHRR